MSSNRDRAQRWMDRALGQTDRDLGGTGNVFYRGDSVYSYGHHFEMARVMRHKNGEPNFVLVNGDSYSPTTTQHQGMVRNVIADSGLPFVILPHEALRGAGIDHDSIEPIHVRPDRNETLYHESPTRPRGRPADMDDPSGATEPYKRWDYTGERRQHVDDVRPVRVPDPNRVHVNDGWSIADLEPDGVWRWTTVRHWLGDSLVWARVHGRRGRHKFLSSFDYQESTPLYFLCELPRGADVWSVEQAYEALKPDEVKAAEEAELHVTRQGDIFAIPTNLTTREVKRLTPWGKGRIVKRPHVLGTNHTATNVMFATQDRVYARGTLYHDPGQWRGPDHRRQRMGDGKTWHLLARNTVPRARPIETVRDLREQTQSVRPLLPSERWG